MPKFSAGIVKNIRARKSETHAAFIDSTLTPKSSTILNQKSMHACFISLLVWQRQRQRQRETETDPIQQQTKLKYYYY